MGRLSGVGVAQSRDMTVQKEHVCQRGGRAARVEQAGRGRAWVSPEPAAKADQQPPARAAGYKCSGSRAARAWRAIRARGWDIPEFKAQPFEEQGSPRTTGVEGAGFSHGGRSRALRTRERAGTRQAYLAMGRLRLGHRVAQHADEPFRIEPLLQPHQRVRIRLPTRCEGHVQSTTGSAEQLADGAAPAAACGWHAGERAQRGRLERCKKSAQERPLEQERGGARGLMAQAAMQCGHDGLQTARRERGRRQCRREHARQQPVQQKRETVGDRRLTSPRVAHNRPACGGARRRVILYRRIRGEEMEPSHGELDDRGTALRDQHSERSARARATCLVESGTVESIGCDATRLVLQRERDANR
eukprot:scaffold12884_cov111-Isochrysis_galbana.AAC.7